MRVVVSAHKLLEDPGYFRWNGDSREVLAHADPFLEELADFTSTNRNCGSDMRGRTHDFAGRQRRRRAREEYAFAARRCFGGIINGPVWDRHRLGHTCRYRACCASLRDAREKVWGPCLTSSTDLQTLRFKVTLHLGAAPRWWVAVGRRSSLGTVRSGFRQWPSCRCIFP